MDVEEEKKEKKVTSENNSLETENDVSKEEVLEISKKNEIEEKVEINKTDEQKTEQVEISEENELKEEKVEITKENELKEETEDNSTEKDNEEGSTYKIVQEKKNKKQVKTAIAVVVITITILIIAFISTVFALVNLMNDKIIDGIKIKGIELVGLSREDAKLEIEELIKQELGMQIVLKNGEYETSISPSQIEANYCIDEAIEKAYSFGRNGNIIQNNYEILFAMLFGKDIEIDFSYNDKTLTQMCEDMSNKIPGAIKETSYYIEGEKLIITEGIAGKTIKIEELKKLIINQILDGKNKNAIEIPTEDKEPEKINIDKIYQEIYKEPKDAYYTTQPFTIYPHEDGVDFAISIEEAKKILKEDKSEYEIPLKYTTPAKTTRDIGAEAFPDLISKFSTKYDVTLKNRTTNLELASNKINGYVLLPGEEFSYNKVVGERTIAAGYKEAAMYSGGEVVDGLGGGICQISSTLYNVAVKANLDITKRSNHQFVTSYVDAGKDATVVYGSIDFKFVNTRKYPIKIMSTVQNGIVEMKIFGVKEDVEYDIEIETETLNYIPYSVKYIEDPTLDAGIEKVKQYGAQGRKTKAYKVCRLNGVVVSKTLLSTDTYSPMNKIIRRGTKGATTVKSTAPTNNKENATVNTPVTNNTANNKVN